MATTTTYPLTRARNAILGSLLALAAIAWGILVWQSTMAGADAMGLTMGVSVPLFVAMWLAMMAAMMFPAAAPMILMFARVQAGKRQREQPFDLVQGRPFVPTWVFLAGYFLVWTATAVPAYLAAWAVDSLVGRSPDLSRYGLLAGGIVLMAAGLYELTPLKNLCLRQCRSPLDFILFHWREGYAGALGMGLRHGTYCLGCCWLLFAIFFAVGVMNLAWMGLLAALIFLEKVSPHGVAISRLAALLLLATGALLLADADLVLGL